MNCSLRAVSCGLLLAAALCFACVQDQNPPQRPGPGVEIEGDGGTDGGADAGGGGGGGAGGGGGDAGTFCIYSGAEAQSFLVTAVPGGLDRITIDRELASGVPRCVRVTLVNPPVGNDDGGLLTPAGWGFESALFRDRACSAGSGSGTSAAATGINGEVTFVGDAGALYPASLSINAIVFGDPVNGFPPAQTCVSGADLPVQ